MVNEENSVSKIYRSFSENIFSINSFFLKFETIAIDEDVSQRIVQDEFVENLTKEITSEIIRLEQLKEASPDFDLDSEIEGRDFDKMVKRVTRMLSRKPNVSSKNFDILSRSSFLMLNNYFEYLLADLLTYYYTKFKDSLKGKEFKVSLDELSEYDSIDDLVSYLIIKEVEGILVEKTFDQLLDHFDKVFDISLENEIINWDDIKEFRERRHLIVHNSSIVNKKYLLRTGNPYKLKIGDIVEIKKDYFHRAYRSFRLAGHVLLFNCWGKWDKETVTNAIDEILKFSFGNLVENDFETVLKVCRYSDKIDARNPEQEEFILKLKFNKAIALKKLGKKAELTKVLKSIPVGIASPIYKLAHKILSDDNSSILESMSNVIALNELSREQYEEWPLFDFIRNDENLNSGILDIFAKL